MFYLLSTCKYTHVDNIKTYHRLKYVGLREVFFNLIAMGRVVVSNDNKRKLLPTNMGGTSPCIFIEEYTSTAQSDISARI